MTEQTSINWSDVMGTARVVRRGPLIVVGGLASLDDAGSTIHLNDAYAQTHRILERLSDILASLDADVSDVVRTRVFVAKTASWQDVARAHGEFFTMIRPVTTMTYNDLMNPDFLLEIDATAWTAPDPCATRS